MSSVRPIFITVIAPLICFTPSSFSGQNDKIRISTQEETAQDMATVPCKESARLEAVKALFIKMGAPTENVTVEKRDGVENVVLRRSGKSGGNLVIGAHYDKTIDGCGAIDNWTGIVALAHLYRSLKDAPSQKNLIFVAFGKEEQGLLGSKAMVKGIKQEEVEQYCAMINIDSLGMAAPQVMENISSRPLVERTAEIAQRMKMPFTKISIPQADSDSSSFRDRKIPALTISGLGNRWQEVMHTLHDQAAKVNQASVYLGYRLALSLIAELDGLPCDVSRGETKTK